MRSTKEALCNFLIQLTMDELKMRSKSMEIIEKSADKSGQSEENPLPIDFYLDVSYL